MKHQLNTRRLLSRISAISFLLPLSLGQMVRAEEEAKHPAKVLLWKISGNGLTQPSYLFGTIHLGDPRVTNLHPAAQKAFDSAESVHTEVPLDQASQMAMVPLMMRKDGKKLDDSIGGELAAGLNAELKRINPALDSKAFQPLATWAIAMMLPILPDQMAGRTALDQKLWNNAASAGKATAGIEVPKEQIGFFLELKEEEQVILLSETLKALKKDREEGRDSMKLLLEAYITGETGKISEEMDRGMKEMAEGEHKEFGERMMKRLLTDRDKTMAESIAGTLKKEPGKIHFFAAGAAHFASGESIISHLEKAGYAITRIQE